MQTAPPVLPPARLLQLESFTYMFNQPFMKF